MRQYEIAIRIAQVHHLAEERKYKKALTVIQTLDMRQVRNISDLKVFAEVYTRTEQFEAAKATYLRIYKKSRTRRILYRLIYLAIRTVDSIGNILGMLSGREGILVCDLDDRAWSLRHKFNTRADRREDLYRTYFALDN